MRYVTVFAALFAAAVFIGPGPQAHAQIAVQVGPAPVCPYGYYAYAPYNCAPYGYYGPEWFNGGVFVGAGPWFHGPEHWHGRVDRHLNPRYGYRGPLPRRGERDEWQGNHWRGHPQGGFHGNVEHDGHGHEYRGEGHGHGHDHD